MNKFEEAYTNNKKKYGKLYTPEGEVIVFHSFFNQAFEEKRIYKEANEVFVKKQGLWNRHGQLMLTSENLNLY